MSLRCDTYTADTPDDLASIPGIRDLASVELRSTATGGRRGSVTFSSHPPTVSWADADPEVQAIADEVARIARARIGAPWRRPLAGGSAYGLAVIAASTAAALTADAGFGVPWAVVAFTFVTIVALALTLFVRRDPSLLVRIHPQQGVKAQIRDKWLDWLVGGVVVGTMMLIIGRFI